MKRKEEIMQEANTRYGVNHPFINIAKESFIEGAKWADRTMLDRACKWLENRHNIEKCLNILTSRTEDLSKAFRRAMEGGAE